MVEDTVEPQEFQHGTFTSTDGKKSIKIDCVRSDNCVNRRERKSPEELYDLTKPIPREEKPNIGQHELETDTISKTIDNLQEERRIIQEKIDSSMECIRNSAVGKEREALRKLRKTKFSLIEEKKELKTRLDTTKIETNRLFNDRKAVKANIRFSDVKMIDNEIMKLKKKQETTSMSLNEEKRLIKEIGFLQSSKELVTDLNSKDANLDDFKGQEKVIKSDLTAKDAEIDLVQKMIEEKTNALSALGNHETQLRKNRNALIKERDAIKIKINEKKNERSSLKKIFREANDRWYDYQRALRAQRKLKADEDKKRYEEEKLARQQEREEEELRKMPYEEEISLCNYLINYLSRTYLTDVKNNLDTIENNKVIPFKDGPFYGMKPVKNKSDDVFFQIGKEKKKNCFRSSKKRAPTVLSLNFDSFEQFGLLKLIPPRTYDMVEKSVVELQEKKKWFSEQPHGTVPTIREIRKINQKATVKSRNNRDTSLSRLDNSQRGNSTRTITGDDFVPLSSKETPVTILNSSWCQKVVEDEYCNRIK